MSGSEFLRRVRHLFARDRAAEDLREEMRLHIELRARQLRERGLAADQAGYAAGRQFGNREWYADKSMEIWGWTVWERMVQDFRMGARTLRKTPGFTAVAVLTLAVGLGMNTAVYSVVNAVMLRALPYAQPGRLTSLWEEYPNGKDDALNTSGAPLGKAELRAGMARTTVSIANIGDYAKSQAFTGMASCDLVRMNLTGTGVPERLAGEAVSASFFSVLGIAPFRGRDFRVEDDSRDAVPVVMISYGFWQRRLGGDTRVLEHSVMLDGRMRRVIGVLPRGFQPPSEIADGAPREFYVPAAYSKQQLQERGDHDVNVVARLKPGVSMRGAQADLDVIQAALARQFPDTNKDIHPAIGPLRDDLVKDTGTALWSLMGASALLVLIACVNVANLLMVRANGRRRESSVRLAVGASRIRLLRLFLAESLLLAAGGCAAGVLLGAALTRTLIALAPAGIPRLESTTMDWPVFAFAAAIAILTGVLFGIAPAWQASQSKPVEALKTAARSSGGKAQLRWRASLTVVEVGLSLVLLVGAGLLLRSFATVMGVDLGFQPDRVLAMNINLPDLRYKTAGERLRFFETLEQRVRALPGVRSVAYANRMPMRGSWRSGFRLDASSGTLLADFQMVSPEYFETLGIGLLRGRVLTAHDGEGQPPVAVVNQAFGRDFLNGQDPLGRSFLYRRDARVEIVGVVSDIRRGGKTAPVLPEVYLSAAQTGLAPVRLADFAVRTSGNPLALVTAVRQQVLEIDKDQPITNVRSMGQVIDESVAQRRFQMLLLAVFAAVALALAVIGIYGVLSYSVAQRTGELGIRIALGANPRGIVGMVMGQAGKLILAGLVVGLAGALVLTRFLESLLFQLGSADWPTYACAVVVLALAAGAAALVPAMRSARVDPIVALRDE
jgi:putative ABC transport system permease protein